MLGVTVSVAGARNWRPLGLKTTPWRVLSFLPNDATGVAVISTVSRRAAAGTCKTYRVPAALVI